jgi:hypothetical protein
MGGHCARNGEAFEHAHPLRMDVASADVDDEQGGVDVAAGDAPTSSPAVRGRRSAIEIDRVRVPGRTHVRRESLQAPRDPVAVPGAFSPNRRDRSAGTINAIARSRARRRACQGRSPAEPRGQRAALRLDETKPSPMIASVMVHACSLFRKASKWSQQFAVRWSLARSKSYSWTSRWPTSCGMRWVTRRGVNDPAGPRVGLGRVPNWGVVHAPTSPLS